MHTCLCSSQASCSMALSGPSSLSRSWPQSWELADRSEQEGLGLGGAEQARLRGRSGERTGKLPPVHGTLLSWCWLHGVSVARSEAQGLEDSRGGGVTEMGHGAQLCGHHLGREKGPERSVEQEACKEHRRHLDPVPIVLSLAKLALPSLAVCPAAPTWPAQWTHLLGSNPCDSWETRLLYMARTGSCTAKRREGPPAPPI